MESEGPNNISEYEKWVKLMVKKQTEKSISFERQFEQHKHFVAVDNQFTVPESFKGFHTLPELQLAQITQDELNKYKLAGLSETEIELYLQYQKNKEAAMGSTTTVKLSNMEMEPTVFMGKIEEIKLKLKQFIQSQEGEQASFTGILKDPFYHVAQLAEKIDYNKQVNRKKIAKRHHENYKFPSANETKTENTTENKTIDSSLLQVAVPLEEEDILQNRLSLDEIKEMAKFRKYTPGIPSNILYIKNLHNKVDIRELIALFGRFDLEENIKYRILNGKMRGQAFVTFKDEKTAEKAFCVINGYRLRNRPIIIEYSQKKK